MSSNIKWKKQKTDAFLERERKLSKRFEIFTTSVGYVYKYTYFEKFW